MYFGNYIPYLLEVIDGVRHLEVCYHVLHDPDADLFYSHALLEIFGVK